MLSIICDVGGDSVADHVANNGDGQQGIELCWAGEGRGACTVAGAVAGAPARWARTSVDVGLDLADGEAARGVERVPEPAP